MFAGYAGVQPATKPAGGGDLIDVEKPYEMSP